MRSLVKEDKNKARALKAANRHFKRTTAKRVRLGWLCGYFVSVEKL